MTLILHAHPFASFCQKVILAFYENETPFEQRLVDLMDPVASAPFRALWPVAKMPVLEDPARGVVLPESSVIIEYLDLHYPGATRFLPADPDQALQVRRWDRVFDHYVQEPVQKIVVDRLRPPGASDVQGVAQARAMLTIAYDLIEARMAGRTWVAGDAFTLADCAAAPALAYADVVHPLGDAYPNASAYLARLKARPSFARTLREAEPYWVLFPKEAA